MVPVVQLVRASDCGSECRGFESHRAPCKSPESLCFQDFFRLYHYNTSIIPAQWKSTGDVFFVSWYFVSLHYEHT